MQLMAV
jgi:hypothetical protein